MQLPDYIALGVATLNACLVLAFVAGLKDAVREVQMLGTGIAMIPLLTSLYLILYATKIL